MSTHNIRYYTNMGLVPSLKHDKNKNRVFNEESINWLICIRFLRESGMSITNINHYFDLCLLGSETIMERFEILKKLQEQSEQELENMQHRTECIRNKVKHYEHILSGEEPDDCNPINWPVH